MKKFLLGLALSIIFFIGAFSVINITNSKVATCYAETISESENLEANESDLKSEVRHYIDLAVVGVSGTLIALVIFLPIYLKIKKAKNSIDQAVGNSSSENTRGEKIIASLKELDKKMEEREKHLLKREERIKRMEKSISNTEEIVRLGFTNSNELVSKGVAAKIANVGKEGEGSEEE